MNYSSDPHYLHIKGEESISLAMDFTVKFAEQTGFSPDVILFLKLATEEACTNAIEYGNHTKQNGFIISWDFYQNNYLTITVRHKGKIFKLHPHIKQRNDSPRGRGIQLIVQLMDHVQVRQDKEFVELIMKKWIAPHAILKGKSK